MHSISTEVLLIGGGPVGLSTALGMVIRANQAYGEFGGHIASYASAADKQATCVTGPHDPIHLDPVVAIV